MRLTDLNETIDISGLTRISSLVRKVLVFLIAVSRIIELISMRNLSPKGSILKWLYPIFSFKKYMPYQASRKGARSSVA